MKKLKESIKFIRSIKSIRSVDPCGALCLRQLGLPITCNLRKANVTCNSPLAILTYNSPKAK